MNAPGKSKARFRDQLSEKPSAVKVFCDQFPQENERSRSRGTSKNMAQLPNSREFGYEISSRH